EPQHLHDVAAPATENEYVARQGLLFQHRLHLRAEPMKAAPHVSHPGRDPYPRVHWKVRHPRRLASTARTIVGSTLPSKRIRTAPGSSTWIAPALTEVHATRAGFTPYFCATRATEVPLPNVSSTISRRSAALRRRRGTSSNPTPSSASNIHSSSTQKISLYTRPTPDAYGAHDTYVAVLHAPCAGSRIPLYSQSYICSGLMGDARKICEPRYPSA